MRVVVDRKRCLGNGLCEATAPDVFRLNDDCESEVLTERPDVDLLAKVQEAVRLCPTQALSLVDEPR